MSSHNSLRCLWIIIVCVTNATSVLGQNFEVEGTLACTYYHNATNSVQETGFLVSVNGDQWQIRTTFKKDSYYVHGCDGTNIYCLFIDDTEPVPLGSNKVLTDPKTLPIPGLITDGLCPLDAEYYTILPWLAFASSKYLDANAEAIPAFWVNPRSTFLAWLYKGRVQLWSQSSPRLPLQMTFATSKESIASATTNSALRIEAASEQEKGFRGAQLFKIKSGLVGGDFVVDASTNFNNMSFPLSFSARTFDNFHATPLSTNLSVYTNMVFLGKVTRVSTSSVSNSYLPPMDRKVSVVDYRFRQPNLKLDYIEYFITNELWPPATDPQLMAIWTEKKDSVPSFGADMLKHFFIYLILGVIAFAPIIFITKGWSKKQNKQTKGNTAIP